MMIPRFSHFSRTKHAHLPLALLLACGCLLLAACGAAWLPLPTQTSPASQAAAAPTATALPEAATSEAEPPAQAGVITEAAPATTDASPPTQTQPATAPTRRTPPEPDAWKELPVIPALSDTARQVYLSGLEAGRDPHAFSKVGDCQSITTYFLARFDMPGYYQLGDQAHLQETIDWFAGSFGRESLAVKGGLNAASMLSPLRADPDSCQAGESPLACELRVNNPSLAIISLEEWWADDPTKYERYMRQIIDYTLSQDILPILATKADNLEGNHLINQTIALLAWEYDLPLWNFWLAVQPLPNHGLVQKTADGQADLFHLTHSSNFYNYTDLQALQSGWAMRNLTALQVLDALRRALNEPPTP